MAALILVRGGGGEQERRGISGCTYMNIIHYGGKARTLGLPLVDERHGVVKVANVFRVHLEERGEALHDVS